MLYYYCCFYIEVVISLLLLYSPSDPKEPEKEEAWSDMENDVNHLTSDTFNQFTQANPSTLVMFYAPCKCFIQPTPILLYSIFPL